MLIGGTSARVTLHMQAGPWHRVLLQRKKRQLATATRPCTTDCDSLGVEWRKKPQQGGLERAREVGGWVLQGVWGLVCVSGVFAVDADVRPP